MPLRVLPSLRRGGVKALDALHRHPLAWALLLSAGLMAALLLTLTPHFATNDDMALQSVVDGSLTGEPRPDLVFTHVALGLMLQGLYRAAGSFPWYGAYLYLLHFAALTVLAYVVFSGRRDGLGVRVLLLGATVAAFHVPMWLDLQFTSTALLLGVTGVVLFRSAVDRGPAPRLVIAVAGAMVGLSWWVRWWSGAAAILLGAAVLAPALRRANRLRFAAFAGVVLTVLATGWAVEDAYYAGRADWQDYFTFNEVRGQLHQTGQLGEVAPEVLADVGWSENDLRLFADWFFVDPTVYQTDDLKAIAASLPVSFEPAEAARLLGGQATDWPGGLRVGLTAALGALAWQTAGRRTRWALAISTLATLATAFLLAATTKLPDRVAVPLLAFMAVSFLAAQGEDRPAVGVGTGGRRHRAWEWAGAAVAVCAMIIGAVAAVDSSRSNEQQAANRRELLARLYAVDPDGVFVAWASQPPRSAGPLLPPSREGPEAIHLVSLGWMTQSPTALAVLRRYSIDDLYTAIAAGGDVYLPLRQEENAALYLTYLREHYGFSGLLKPVAKVGRMMVFNGVAAYEVDEAAGTLVERHLDGSTVAYPLAGPIEGQRATTTPAGDEGQTIEGRARATLVVVTDGASAVALALPEWAADRLPRFDVTLEHAVAGLRLFALSDGHAVEITLTGATP